MPCVGVEQAIRRGLELIEKYSAAPTVEAFEKLIAGSRPARRKRRPGGTAASLPWPPGDWGCLPRLLAPGCATARTRGDSGRAAEPPRTQWEQRCRREVRRRSPIFAAFNSRPAQWLHVASRRRAPPRRDGRLHTVRAVRAHFGALFRDVQGRRVDHRGGQDGERDHALSRLEVVSFFFCFFRHLPACSRGRRSEVRTRLVSDISTPPARNPLPERRERVSFLRSAPRRLHDMLHERSSEGSPRRM